MTKKYILEGIKVVEFAWIIVGPAIGRGLAEHGATVIRVESHKRPDLSRISPPFRDGIPGIDRSAYYATYNAAKYGMSLDLTQPKGGEVARKLVAWADVVGESMTPGAMARLGLDYESCRRIKPDIVYYSITLVGQKGPYSNFSLFGNIGASYAGLSQVLGWPDRWPQFITNAHPDLVCPPLLRAMVVAALEYRRCTGKGMYLDMSMMETAIGFLGPGTLDYVVNDRIATRLGNRDPHMAPHGAFPCLGDDEWATIAVGSDEEWQALCQVMGQPEWAQEPRFATLQWRKENEDELEHLIAEWTKDYPPEQVMVMLQSAGVPAGVVATAQDLFEDPQCRHRGHFVPLEHRVIGVHHYHMPSHRFSKTLAHPRRAAPCLGQDNEFVYKEILGYTDEEVTQLLLDGVITTEHDIPDILKPKKPK